MIWPRRRRWSPGGGAPAGGGSPRPGSRAGRQSVRLLPGFGKSSIQRVRIRKAVADLGGLVSRGRSEGGVQLLNTAGVLLRPDVFPASLCGGIGACLRPGLLRVSGLRSQYRALLARAKCDRARRVPGNFPCPACERGLPLCDDVAQGIGSRACQRDVRADSAQSQKRSPRKPNDGPGVYRASNGKVSPL